MGLVKKANSDPKTSLALQRNIKRIWRLFMGMLLVKFNINFKLPINNHENISNMTVSKYTVPLLLRGNYGGKVTAAGI